MGGLSKIFKKVASVALPIVGNLIAPGIGGVIGGALGGAVGGGGIGGALLGGLGGGLLNGASGVSGMLGGVSSLLGGSTDPNSMIAGRSVLQGSAGADPFVSQLPKGTQMVDGLPWQGKNKDTNLIDTGGGNFLQNLGSSGGQGAIEGIGALLSMMGSLNPVAPKGSVTQQAIQDQIASQKAADEKTNEGFMKALNAPGLSRQQTSAPIDYYHYGQRPESQFFDQVNAPAPAVGMKHGGQVGNGQADDVPVNLSQGEFVVPADVVAHLGDGNTHAGGKQLSAMIKGVRKAKGAKPGLPKKAKSPLSYVGAA